MVTGGEIGAGGSADRVGNSIGTGMVTGGKIGAGGIFVGAVGGGICIGVGCNMTVGVEKNEHELDRSDCLVISFCESCTELVATVLLIPPIPMQEFFFVKSLRVIATNILQSFLFLSVSNKMFAALIVESKIKISESSKLTSLPENCML